MPPKGTGALLTLPHPAHRYASASTAPPFADQIARLYEQLWSLLLHSWHSLLQDLNSYPVSLLYHVTDPERYFSMRPGFVSRGGKFGQICLPYSQNQTAWTTTPSALVRIAATISPKSQASTSPTTCAHRAHPALPESPH